MVFGGIFPLIYLHIRLSPSQAPSFILFSFSQRDYMRTNPRNIQAVVDLCVRELKRTGLKLGN